MSRVAIYRRISKDREGREVNIGVQEKLVREKLIHPDDQVVGVYTDNDISASAHSKKARPDYARLIADAQAGKFDVIAAYTFKRLTRRYDEGGELLALAENFHVGYRFVRGAPVDLNSAAGRKAFRNMVNDAISESDETSERIRDLFADKRAAGEFIGGKKTGYLRADNGQLVPDPDWAPRILADTRRVLAGVSLSTLVREWTDAGRPTPHGGQEWRIGSVKAVLRSPSNAGLIVHNGVEIGPGNWEPIVPEAEWRALVALLADPNRCTSRGPAGRLWLGGSMFLCGRCDDGTVMRTGTSGAPRNGVSRPAYRCSASAHLSISAPDVDAFVLEAVAGILDVRGAGLLDVDHKDQLAELEAMLANLRSRRKANARMFAAGDVSEEEYGEASREITQQINDAQKRIIELSPADGPLAGVADAAQPGAVFLGLPLERQRAVVDSVCTVTIMPGMTGRAGKGKGIDYSRIRIEPR